MLPLLIFAKAPVPGQVKTRLIPALGAEGACALYLRLLEHCLQQTADWSGPRLLYCAPDTQHPALQRLATQHGLQALSQLSYSPVAMTVRMLWPAPRAVNTESAKNRQQPERTKCEPAHNTRSHHSQTRANRGNKQIKQQKSSLTIATQHR